MSIIKPINQVSKDRIVYYKKRPKNRILKVIAVPVSELPPSPKKSKMDLKIEKFMSIAIGESLIHPKCVSLINQTYPKLPVPEKPEIKASTPMFIPSPPASPCGSQSPMFCPLSPGMNVDSDQESITSQISLLKL